MFWVLIIYLWLSYLNTFEFKSKYRSNVNRKFNIWIDWLSLYLLIVQFQRSGLRVHEKWKIRITYPPNKPKNIYSEFCVRIGLNLNFIVIESCYKNMICHMIWILMRYWYLWELSHLSAGEAIPWDRDGSMKASMLPTISYATEFRWHIVLKWKSLYDSMGYTLISNAIQ